MTVKLITLAEYEKLTPRQQGYVVYMQGAHEGSELKDLQNPYVPGTKLYEEWNAGEQRAVLDAQDSEE